MMVSSKQILEATGIRNIKTLTRWHHFGIIPAPIVQTSPSGRGKMGYWPDWVLDRVRRITELQRLGHSLRSAVAQFEAERVSNTLKQVTSAVSHESRIVKLPDGCEIRLGDLFIEIVVKELGAVLSRNVIAHIVPKLRNIRALDMAITCYQNGFNPILAFDGDQVFVTRDFLVSYDLSDGMPKAHVYLPLLPALRSIMKSSFAGDPATRPAPKVWTRQGNDTVETEFLPLSDGLCEMQRWTDKVIEHSEDPEQK